MTKMGMELVPDRAAAMRLLRAGKIVTLRTQLVADLLTPTAAFQRLAPAWSEAYLLESVEGGEQVGRLSIVGLGAARRYTWKDGVFTETADGKPRRTVETAHPLRELRTAFAGLTAAPAELGVRFNGGAVGYLGYECVRSFEDIELKGATTLGGFPEMDFRVADLILVFDRVLNRLHLLTYVFPGGDPGRAYAAAVRKLARLERQLGTVVSRPAELIPPLTIGGKIPIRGKSNFTKPAYEAAVRRALRYIRAGDIFQVVLAQRWSYSAAGLDPFTLYRALRVINPSPYMFFLKTDGVRYLIGSSPEILVRLEGQTATVRPIAGTRPRGRDEAADRALAESLRADEKEKAEHIMLVDLGRNDLGRVCRYGMVTPTELMAIEKYSHVMHMVSNVEGELRDGYDAFDLLEATFPAGTVSGAPKIRAMEIINELEPGPRGPYAGSVGYFAFNGNLDMCITIRTIYLDGKKLYLQAGGGLVADSVPAKEWEESVNKARGMQTALDWARRLGRVRR